MFRKLSSGFRMPSGEVKETAEVLEARDKLSAASTIKNILELYVSRKNMGVILESTPIIASSSYYLFREYINKSVSSIPEDILKQIKSDLDQDRIHLLKAEHDYLKYKLKHLIDDQLQVLQSPAPAARAARI